MLTTVAEVSEDVFWTRKSWVRIPPDTDGEHFQAALMKPKRLCCTLLSVIDKLSHCEVVWIFMFFSVQQYTATTKISKSLPFDYFCAHKLQAFSNKNYFKAVITGIPSNPHSVFPLEICTEILLTVFGKLCLL